MTKIVINTNYGGFDLSEDALELYAQRKSLTLYILRWGGEKLYSFKPFKKDLLAWGTVTNVNGYLKIFSPFQNKEDQFWAGSIKRDDPTLVEVVEELGPDAEGQFSELGIQEIPENTEWHIKDYDGIEQIEEYDGSEWIAEKHRTWGK